MRFSATVVFLPGLTGLATAGNIFKYCNAPSFEGSCVFDDADSLNHCEASTWKTTQSLKVYKDTKCTIFMGSGCTGDSRAYTTGEVPNVPEMYQAFKTYKCVKDSITM